MDSPEAVPPLIAALADADATVRRADELVHLLLDVLERTKSIVPFQDKCAASFHNAASPTRAATGVRYFEDRLREIDGQLMVQ